MDSSSFSHPLFLLAAAIILFLISREVNMWYWKINKHIVNQRATNFHLERIAKQLGCSDGNVVVLESIDTGKTLEIALHQWLASEAFEENQKIYRIIGLKNGVVEPKSEAIDSNK